MGEFLLCAILVEGGFSYSDARMIEKALDRGRWGGKSPEKIAQAIQAVIDRHVAEQRLLSYNAAYGYPDVHTFREPGLFDEECPF